MIIPASANSTPYENAALIGPALIKGGPEMPSQAEYLAAIRSSPDDDALRLAYAEWLDSQHHPQAQLIRVQCALAKLNADAPGRETLEEDESSLLGNNEERWVSSFDKGDVLYTLFRRGFVEGIRFHLQDLREQLTRFSTSPYVSVLRHINVDESVCNDETLSEMLNFDYLSHVEDLNLARTNIGPKSLRSLAASRALANVRGLTLNYNQIGPFGAKCLAQSVGMKCLRNLGVAECAIGDEGLIALAGAPFVANLIEINLRTNQIGPA